MHWNTQLQVRGIAKSFGGILLPLCPCLSCRNSPEVGQDRGMDFSFIHCTSYCATEHQFGSPQGACIELEEALCDASVNGTASLPTFSQNGV